MWNKDVSDPELENLCLCHLTVLLQGPLGTATNYVALVRTAAKTAFTANGNANPNGVTGASWLSVEEAFAHPGV